MARIRTGEYSASVPTQTSTGAGAGAGANSRTTRITRSQSREPVQPNAIRPQQRATHGQSDALSDTHGVEIGRLNDINEDVSENESIINGRQQSVLSGGLSAATTTRTTFSQDDAAEMRELDPEMVIDGFPFLLPRADHVLNLVFKELNGDLSFIDADDARGHKFLLKRLQDYNSQKSDFTSQHYIRPDIVLRAVLKLRANQQIAPDPWRPDDIIFKANLAGLISHISQCGNTVKQAEVLQALDSDFPRRFMLSLEVPQAASGHIGESVLDEETCLLALHLRTQLAVKALALNAVDPDPEAPQAIIAQVFLGGDYAHAGVLPDELDVLMLRSFDLISDGAHPVFREHVVERIKDLKAAFDEYEDADEAIYHLQEKYAWSEFRLHLVEWVKLRSEEISASIIKRGGGSNLEESADKIIARLSRKMAKIDPSMARILGDRINRTPRASGLSGVAPSSNPTSPHRNPVLTSGKLQANANTAGLVNEANSAITRPLASTTNSMQPFNVDDDDEDDAFEEPANPPPPRAPTNSKRPAAPSSREATGRTEDVPDKATEVGAMLNSILVKPSASGKSSSRAAGRSLMDRQPNAERVQFSQESQQRTRLPGQQVDPPSSPPISSVTGKRTVQHADILDDDEDRPTQAEPSQDRGFQGNTRSNQFVQRAASIPNSSRTVPIGEADEPSPSKRVRQNPGQSIDPLPADLTGRDAATKTSGQKWAETNRNNKLQTRIFHGQTQSRTAWSIEETTRLIDLVEENGPLWATIKLVDEKSLNSFARRDQVGLRDKARNLRVDFEIAQARNGTPMPSNFQLVALGKKEYEKLEKAGVILEREHVRNV